MLLIFKDLKNYLRSLVVFFVMPACPASFFKERFSPRLSSASPPECGRVAEVTRQAGMTDNYWNRVPYE
jgi:hypothetical protein